MVDNPSAFGFLGIHLNILTRAAEWALTLPGMAKGLNSMVQNASGDLSGQEDLSLNPMRLIF